MIDQWFEEDLILLEEYSKDVIKELIKTSKLSEIEASLQLKSLVNGILRVDKPRWGRIDEETHLLKSARNNTFFLVRLGFQFDFPDKVRDRGIHFVFARCEAYLWSSDNCQSQPRVYEVIPSQIYEGEPHKVTVKVGPEIKINDIGGSIGEVSTDFNVGYITPSIVGWTGEDERAPYWELRPNTKELLGTQHLWLLVEFPREGKGFRLATRAEAHLQTFLGPIAIGPKDRMWSSRPSVVIS